MGNQTSLSPEVAPPHSSRPNSTFNQNLRNLLRSSGSLGLSRAELDKRCSPSGLYPSCKWDDRTIRRLIGDGKIAARLRGTELRTCPADSECPICFLHYSEVNVTKCCQAQLCTECYLQVRPQKVYAPCPFCNSSRLHITIANALGPQAIQQRAEEEQRVIEATIRARAESKHQICSQGNDGDIDCASQSQGTGDHPVHAEEVLTNGSSFGSSLAQDLRIASIRKRSESLVSESSQNTSSESLVQDITALAITPEERALLEEEVRVQHLHPLAQRMEAEQLERRLQNEREYYRTQVARLRELRSRRELITRTLGETTAASIPIPERSHSSDRPSEWNRFISALENRSNGRSSFDDLALLEAAFGLSVEEDSRQRERPEQRVEESAARSDDGTILSQQPLSDGDNIESTELRSQLRNFVRAFQASQDARRISESTSLGVAEPFGGSSHDFESILLRGLSEEEQIAMAIAASLGESCTHNLDHDNHSD